MSAPEATVEPATRPHPRRQPSIDQEAANKLEKKLTSRPDKQDLLDRNILKGDSGSVAPSLIAAQEKLKRAQLENRLEHAIQHRPKAEELVKDGILNADEVPTTASA